MSALFLRPFSGRRKYMKDEIMSVIKYALKERGIEDMPSEYTVKVENGIEFA